jgi:hypothetical protein
VTPSGALFVNSRNLITPLCSRAHGIALVARRGWFFWQPGEVRADSGDLKRGFSIPLEVGYALFQERLQTFFEIVRSKQEQQLRQHVMRMRLEVFA